MPFPRLPAASAPLLSGPPGRKAAQLLLSALPQALLLALAAPLRAEPAPRPADLVILEQKQTFRGPETIGLYGRQPEPGQPGQWRVKIWRERIDRLVLDTESIDCRPGQATRIGAVDNRVVVQTLNPGGLITPANRLDHLIWWATCAPELAGRDPAQLASEARRRGFDGRQQENLTVLPGVALPHP